MVYVPNVVACLVHTLILTASFLLCYCLHCRASAYLTRFNLIICRASRISNRPPPLDRPITFSQSHTFVHCLVLDCLWFFRPVYTSLFINTSSVFLFRQTLRGVRKPFFWARPTRNPYYILCRKTRVSASVAEHRFSRDYCCFSSLFRYARGELAEQKGRKPNSEGQA
ncbi:hypothetical protein BO82DRAFT_14345 [Aspergillus uvarum CBS 121591]|uniref:Uncharacterized protein n=1 Tax=Aspergillus uvarum CBS 121591 TaxID=1448315 RepID=A0A319BSU3_9EURO|nr:hypothetical protein BO82DRAFT_14345 [Aspergillus uvarum CBS 121591]PYH75745.1 hypothetical protein BO82DRAFT_14345 [Aspergillus uvarum CBS 121591]